jgi:hypothetical protein
LLFDRTTYLWTYVLLSGGARLASNQVGELSRAWWQGLPAPSTLTYHTTPQPRRIKKKVSKRVPKPKPQVQQQQLELGSGELLQAGAVAAGVAAAAATDAVLLADQVTSVSSHPIEGMEAGAAPVAPASSSVEGAVAESLPAAVSVNASLPQSSEIPSSSSPVSPALSEGSVEQPATIHLTLPVAGYDSEQSSSSSPSVAPQPQQQQPEFARH